MPTEGAGPSGGAQAHEAIVVGAGGRARLPPRRCKTAGSGQSCPKARTVPARWRSGYQELRLNSWRALSNLQGYRMPRNHGRYPGRGDFASYLDGYAAHQRLRIRFNTALARVERASDRWRPETSTHPVLARYVVIATGWDAVPVVPDWPGRESFVCRADPLLRLPRRAQLPGP